MIAQMWSKTCNKKLVKVWQSGEHTSFEFCCGCTINTLPLWEYLMSFKNFVWTEDGSHEKKCKNMMFVPLSYLIPFTLVVMLSNEHHKENEWRVL